ncbi:MAG: T9SS type A sorting domain-containing protein, partial [Saprospiraceae bacterium]
LSASDVLMFPNPKTAMVTIEITKPITGQVMLYNSFGQQLAVQPINQHSTMLDLSTYPTGVYWVALSDMEQQRRVVKKVVKQ